MPEMTRADFGKKVPKNYAAILQYINNKILYHEESVFWNNDPDGTDQWESDLIARYLAGDRTGELINAPDPIYE